MGQLLHLMCNSNDFIIVPTGLSHVNCTADVPEEERHANDTNTLLEQKPYQCNRLYVVSMSLVVGTIIVSPI